MASPISKPLVEPELLDVLSSLAYRVESAEHNQFRIICGSVPVMVGHAFQVWCWLKITNQFHHPMFETIKE